MSKTASEYLVEALEKTGVKRVYGVVGDSLNDVTDALRRRKSIDWIHMRHEEAAAFAAGAEAQARVVEALKVGGETYEGELEMEFLSRLSPEPSS
jgi:TPP-dependent 2-oxoacid decarboxylase